MEDYFISLTAIVAATVAVTEAIKNILKLDGFASQAVSWLTGIVLVLIGWAAGFGFLAEVEAWYIAFLWGAGASLAANGVFDVPVIKKIVKAIVGLFK